MVWASVPYDPGEDWYASVLDLLQGIHDAVIVGLVFVVFLLAIHVVGSWGK